MPSYSQFLQKVGYPVLDAFRGRRLCIVLEQLKKSQWFEREEISRIQRRHLESLLKHAWETSPYYRRLFDSHSLRPRWEDFAALPILTKDDLKANFEEIASKAFPKKQLIPGRTGGSTGTPTHFYHNKASLDHIRGAVLRSHAWAGLFPGDKYLKISGSHFDYNLSQQLFWKAKLALLRHVPFPAIDLSEDRIPAFLDLVEKQGARKAIGYASAISDIAQMLTDKGVSCRLDSVICSSDTLSPSQRAAITAAFSCPVFDSYGTREFMIASECEEHNGMHIHEECVLVEVVDEKGRLVPAGESGRLIVTDLHNHGFPFIRYEIGDVGSLDTSECACGRKLQRIAHLEGRTSDFIRSRRGAKVAAPAFTVLFSDVVSVQRYQIHQHADYSITVSIVRSSRYNQEDELHLKHGLDALFPDGCPYEITYRDSIDYGQSGKRRIVVSEVGYETRP